MSDRIRGGRSADDTFIEPTGGIIEEPVRRVGPGGRGPDRWRIAVVVIISFLAVALIKPWEFGQTSRTAPTGGAASPTPAGSPVPEPSLEPDGVVGPLTYARWGRDIPRTVRDHDQWGVSLLLVARPAGDGAAELTGSGSSIVETWHPVDAISEDRIETATADRDVVAIVVTTPLDEPALDVRVWRSLDGELRFMPSVGVTVPGTIDQRLWLPPDARGGRLDAWAPGDYRLDVLTGPDVVTIALTLPGDPAPLPPLPPVPLAPNDIDLAAWFPRDGFGAFALDGSLIGRVPVVTTLDRDPGAPQDDRAAWLDLGRSPRGADARPEQVNGAALLGVLGRQGDRFRTADLVRLAPVEAAMGPGVVLDTPPDDGPDGFRPAGGTSRLVVFHPPDPTVGFAAGTYRIDASWRDAAGRRQTGSWHIAVYPPHRRGSSPLLDAVRWGASVTGRWAIEGGVRGRPARQEPNSAPMDPAVLGPDCEGVKVVPTEPGVIAVGHDLPSVGGVTLARIFEGTLTVQVPAIVSVAAPGLVIVAPAKTAVWPEGYYTIALHGAEGPSRLVFCVGRYHFATGQLTVPPETTDLEAFLRWNTLEAGE